MHYHGNHSLPVCPSIRHLEIWRVRAWPVTLRPLQPLSEPGPAWFDMNQICQWLKTDTWAAPSRENVARSIQLQSLINNSGREMPQYRAQQDLKIDHALLRRNRGKERGGRNGSMRGASSSTPRPQHRCSCSLLAGNLTQLLFTQQQRSGLDPVLDRSPARRQNPQKRAPAGGRM